MEFRKYCPWCSEWWDWLDPTLSCSIKTVPWLELASVDRVGSTKGEQAAEMAGLLERTGAWDMPLGSREGMGGK